MSNKEKVEPHCPVCDSARVSVEVDTEWDYDDQLWVVSTEYDAGYCADCASQLKSGFVWKTAGDSK